MEPSPTAFARLIPLNTIARIAFDEAYESSTAVADKSHIYVEPRQHYDKDALIFRLQEQKKQQGDANESDSPTDPDTDTENHQKHYGMIWTGWFAFDLAVAPGERTTGWTVGSGRKNVHIDYPVVTRSLATGVRGYHARFNFHQNTGHLFISKVSRVRDAEVIVNGKGVSCGEQFTLNQNSMNIRLGRLEYEFRYTDFGQTEDYYTAQHLYMERFLRVQSLPYQTLTPTPAGTFRTFGSWTVGPSLGKGTYGRVFSATNSKGEIVAIKVVERGQRTVRQVNREIHVLQELQKLSEVNKGDRNRVVRLKESIFQNGTQKFTSAVFDEVALVLEPAVPAMLAQLTAPGSNQRCV
jgi:hypothetical protein